VFAFNCPVNRRRDARPPGPCPRGGAWGGRPPGPALLLAAVFTVAVPGFLVAACSGQSGPVPDKAAAPASGAAPASSSAPSSTAAASTAAASTAAASGAAAATRTPAPRPGSAALAVRLLNQAAQAAVLTSYQGEEIVSHWGTSGGTVLVSDIWHVSGGQTVTRTLAAGTYASGEPYLSSDTDGQWPEGVLGVTTPLVRLLEAHYIVVYRGAGSADNRAAQIVEALRDDGTLAARFWLDDATRLPLEREVFDSAAHVISEDVFINVRFENTAPVSAPAGGPADPQAPWTAPLPASQLLALRARGWLVPSDLPGGLSLFTGAQTRTSTGTVLDLGYSDGLSVVSLFEQRGNLAAKLAGWQKVTVAGHVIYAAEPDQRSLTWSSRGVVYTVMADAPAQTVDDVIGVLPHDTPPGFWKRMSRGLARMASWVNPFR
jgi:sigma-E factor negative regulatory protein RseB